MNHEQPGSSLNGSGSTEGPQQTETPFTQTPAFHFVIGLLWCYGAFVLSAKALSEPKNPGAFLGAGVMLFQAFRSFKKFNQLRTTNDDPQSA